MELSLPCLRNKCWNGTTVSNVHQTGGRKDSLKTTGGLRKGHHVDKDKIIVGNPTISFALCTGD